MGGSGVEPGLICAPDSLQNSDPAREGAAAQDTALMIAVGQGSAPAFGLLVERHTPQL
jgi:hypothetical protein